MLFRLLSCVFFFFLGLVLDASEYRSLMKGVTWTDILGAASAFFTCLIVAATYVKWRESKVREDAYELTKDYLRLLAGIDESLTVSFNSYDNCVPQAGMLYPSKPQVEAWLSEGYGAYFKLNESIYKLKRKKQELGFWGVGLEDRFQKVHNEIIRHVSNYLRIHSVLGNQIQNYYLHDEGRVDSVDNMHEEHQELRQSFYSLRKVLSARFEVKYADYFVYNVKR